MQTPQITIVVGGRWSAFDLAVGLHRRGALHRLVTNYPRWKVKRWGVPADRIVTRTASQWLEQLVRRSTRGRWDTRFQYLVHALFAKQAARCLGSPALVHAWSGYAFATVDECRRRGVPVIVDRMSSHMLTQTKILREECERLGLRREVTHPRVIAAELQEYDRATAVLVPSEFVRGSFLEQGFPAARLRINPFGVNLTQFRSDQSSPGSEAGFRVVYAGSLTYRKGIHYLARAFAAAAIPESRLTLVGGPAPETPALLRGFSAGVEQVGHVPQAELVRHYRNSHVFAIASIEEGMAMVQAQALASGLPLVCTENTGGEDLLRLLAGGSAPVQRGVIREYAAGFVVPPRDVEAMSACLRRLASDPGLRAAQAAAARRIHTLSLDWQAYADRALEIYSGILAPERAD